MKNALIYAGGFLFLLVVYFIIAYGLRYINQNASPITTFHPEKDITCVQVSSADGVALSCVIKP